jgi:hypothetical protein
MLGGVPVPTAWRGYRWRNSLQLWRLAANVLNKQPQTDNKGWSSSLGVGRGAATLHHKNKLVTINLTEPWTWTDSLDKRPKLWNMDMRFGMCNVRSLYRVGSVFTVSRELARYVRFSGSAGGQMGGWWHRTCGRIHIFPWKEKLES